MLLKKSASQKQRIIEVLDDLLVLCAKHKISLHPQYNGTANIGRPTFVVDFGPDGEMFEELNADENCASVYWAEMHAPIEVFKEIY